MKHSSIPVLLLSALIGLITLVFIYVRPRSVAPGSQSVFPTGSITAPPRPVIRLRYGGTTYEGLPGSYCWPTADSSGHVSTLCVDTTFGNPSEVIPVAPAVTLTAELDAYQAPLKFKAQVFTSAGESPLQTIDLGPHLTAPLTFDLPQGMYTLYVFGQWPRGDASYFFKLQVD